MASSNTIYTLMRDYLTICTEHQRLMRESEQSMVRFHNRLSDVLIEYLRQPPVSNYNQRSSIFSSPLERNTGINNRGVGYNNHRYTPSTRTTIPVNRTAPPPVDQTTEPVVPGAPEIESTTRTNFNNITIPHIPPPPPPPPPPSLSTIIEQTTSSLQQSQDMSAHNNLDEQTLPSQVLAHSPPTRVRRRRRVFTRTPIHSARNHNTTVQNRNTTTFVTSFDSPVRIRPSRYQIAQATSILTYSDISGDNIQERCPIDLRDFSDNDSIMRIDQCSHIFREMNLREHFRNSPRCPLCRFDIREHDDLLSGETNTTITSAIENALSTTIASISDLSSNDLVFSYRYIPPRRN